MKNSDNSKGKVLFIAGKNAGKILSGLDVTQFDEGGDVEININLEENNFNNYDAHSIGIVLLWLAAFLTIYTGYDYVRKGIHHATE